MSSQELKQTSPRQAGMTNIGFIGLGTIGAVVARHLQRAGYALVVHDIRLAAVKPLVDGGARYAAAPATVARECNVIFTSLPGPPEVEDVALGGNGLVHGLREGTIYVDLSSSSVALIRRIAAVFNEGGTAVMDAPLIVGKGGIANKSVQVLASGAPVVFDQVKPLLEAFAEPVVYTGELGMGTVIKLAHNLVRRGIGLAIGEGLVLGAKAGVDAAMLWRCMHWGLDVQLGQLLNTFTETAFKGNYEARASFGIGLSRKDVGLAVDLGRQYHVPMPIAALVEQFMIHAVNRGWSEQSTLSLFRLQEEAAGIAVRTKGE